MADAKKNTPNAENTNNWPELAIGLYDKLTGRGAEISYAFDDFEVYVPSSTRNDADAAKWKMNGTLRITTRDNANGGTNRKND